jgi:hypothetical protein
MGDTEVAPESPADDQPTPGVAASPEADPEEEPSAPDPGAAEPTPNPDVKYHG